MPVEEEEYELVPMSPMRRMEKRLDRVEKGSVSGETVKELMDIVRTNQRIVDELVRINTETMAKIGELNAAVTQAVGKIDEFLSKVEIAGEAEEEQKPEQAAQAVPSDVEKRLDRLEKRINSLLLSAVAKNKLSAMRMQRKPFAPMSRPA